MNYLSQLLETRAHDMQRTRWMMLAGLSGLLGVSTLATGFVRGTLRQLGGESLDELSATVSQNADNAVQSKQLALGAAEVAVRGGREGR